ncbi:hypothetical protein [Flagellimonas aequoris]|uniref:Uncharacterized protein n=1 Tax=Flagellimonas aequoris TaxID=2306997 RepID=A0A418N5A5_9FLAO|nr:hypothetical protein [Allomuricauda aequoris]RIV69320.1 hypothetical protein D2U88_13015 [Allomuricauda aequoris]TXK00988.1 hypothetical protein FQ019_12890 [Allomuricauda aequoris]
MKDILLITILFLVLSCSHKESSDSKIKAKENDTVSFVYNGFNHHRKLDLISNQEFIRFESVASCFGDMWIEKHFGRYTATDSTIKLEPRTVELIVYTRFPEEIDQKLILPYGPDSLKINTEYKIFSWKNKEYLLSEEFDSIRSFESRNDYQKFAYYYNIGEEPNYSGNYLTRLKKDSTINIPWDIYKIPKKYRDDFLEEPISVRIIDRKKKVEIDEYDPEGELVSWRIKIDKGTKNGVRKGFHFITKDDKFFIDVDSTQSSVSFGSCYIYNMDEKYFRIGTEMKTKWER